MIRTLFRIISSLRKKMPARFHLQAQVGDEGTCRSRQPFRAVREVDEGSSSLGNRQRRRWARNDSHKGN